MPTRATEGFVDIQADERPSKEVIKARLDRAVAGMIWALRQAREVAPTEEEAAMQLIALAERLKVELDEAFAGSEAEESNAEEEPGDSSQG